MKKITTLIMILVLTISMAALTGCGSQMEDPGPPPEEVINPGNSGGSGTDDSTHNGGNTTSDEDGVLENAVSVRIGRDGRTEWNVNMYDNDAAWTMLGYLSDSGLLFPTYTYDEEGGFVAQSIRGTYSRDDEVTITDVKAGELYLFNGGQLRFYFKDIEGADITATPVGYYTDTEGLAQAVQDAYESNLGDVWGVDVYFWITKTTQTDISDAKTETEGISMKMNVQIGDTSFTVSLEDNDATSELIEMMKEAPISISMSDYSGFEKVGPLGRSLTTDNHQTTTSAGDIVLYSGNQIVMFYGSNSWSYTRIGKIDDLTGWEEALGSGSITAVFSLVE